jgi:hypothetical protein
MPGSPTTEAALVLRSLVQPVSGRPLLLLTELTDDQLYQIILWFKEGKPNELIGRTVIDMWGKCSAVPWPEFMKDLVDFRKAAFSGTEPISEKIELLFDPLSENACFVRELWDKWRTAEEAAHDKSTMEHADRLARILAETIANHATIQFKLGKTPTEQQVGTRGGDTTTIQIGEAKIIMGQLGGTEMPDFIKNVTARLEEYPMPTEKPKAKTAKPTTLKPPKLFKKAIKKS